MHSRFSDILSLMFSLLTGFILLTGCSSASDQPAQDEGGIGPDGRVNIAMMLDLAEPDMQDAMDAANPAEGEVMEKLRIIIIDGEGVIEHNELFDFSTPVSQYMTSFRVKPQDTKDIIFIANEHAATLRLSDADDTPTPASDYFSGLVAGAPLSTEYLKRITIRSADAAPAAGSLHMPLTITAMHTVRIEKSDIYGEYTLWRAATKFSFRIINQSKNPRKLNSISLTGMADREFLFPHASFLASGEIDTFDVPAGTQMLPDYTLVCNTALPANMTMRRDLGTAYFLESPRRDKAYAVKVDLESSPATWIPIEFSRPGSTADASLMFDMPRNTHVLVNIIILDRKVVAITELQPYGEVKYDVLLGLSRDENGNIIDKDGNIIFYVEPDNSEMPPQLIVP